MIANSSIRGLCIIDISNLKQLNIVSTVPLFGKPYRIYFMNKEKYVVVIIQEKPAIVLIDIQDKLNPILLQTMKRKTPENLLSVCFDQDENEGFITTGKPLIQTNFKNQITFHKVIYQLISITGSNEKQYKEVQSQSPLYIGQLINIRLFPINIDNAVSIKKAMVYENYILQPLKSWMTFQPEYNLLQLNILKDALIQNQHGKFIDTSQQIIFQSHIALDTSSFINSYLKIDQPLSAKILAECQKLGYLDEVYMVSENFNYQSQVQISFEKIVDANFLATLTDEKKDDMIKAIKYVFKHSIVYYPIEFVVATSLSFDQTNPQKQYIKSLRKQISFYIRIPQGKGRFVEKSYPGILTIISSQQDEIKMEGNIDNVNEVLSEKIKFSSSTSKDNLIFSIQIQDGINYDIEQQIPYSDAIFISEQSKVKLKEENTIQSDFSNKFEDSSVYIREKFSYQIPSELFESEESSQLYFTAQMKNSNDEFSEISKNNWIQFSQIDRTFSGQPSGSEFNEEQTFIIKISDKYSFVTQELTISAKKVPLIYIFQFFIQYVGPVLGIIGFWRYKYVIINIIQKKSYTYSKEVIQAGNLYQKQILLNNWNINVANQILEQFKIAISTKQIQQQIFEYQSLILNQQGDNSSPLIQNLNTGNNSLYKQESVQFSQNNQTCMGTELKDEIVESHIQSPTFKILSPNFQARSSFKKSNDQNLFNNQQKNNNLIQEEKLMQLSESKKLDLKSSQLIDNKDISVQVISNQQQKSDIQIQQQKQPSTLNINQQTKLSQFKKNNITTLENSIEIKNNRLAQRFNKQLKQQYEKLNKSKLEQSQVQKQITQIDTKKKSIISDDRNQLWLFNKQGKINFCKTIQLLIQNQEKSQTRSNGFTEEVTKQLKNKNSLLRQTFECFLAEYILQKDTFSYNIFKELYNKTQQPLPNPQWYQSYCSIMTNFQDIHKNPLPIITFDDAAIEFEIKSLIFGQNQYDIDQNLLEKIPFSLNLLKETIKGYSLGFVSNSAQLKPLSSGESIQIESYNIKQITSYSQKIDNQLYSKNNKQFIEKPLVDNYKLPPWIKSVEIINNNLLIVGYPENKDIGRVYFFIYSKQNIIIRAYELEVIGSEIDDQKNEEVEEEEKLILVKNNMLNNLNQDCVSKRLIVSEDKINVEKKSQYDFVQTEDQKIQEDTIFDYGEENVKQPHKNQFTL